jgi:ribosomal protein L11 methyltransferase
MSERTFARLLIALEDAEGAWSALYRAGTLGAWERDAPPPAVLIAAFSDGESARLARGFLAENGIDSRLEDRVVERDPFAIHRASLVPFTIGSFRIDPRGEPEGGADSNDPRALWIPAHGAFGTGLHASTRGILRWMDGKDLSDRRVLDVGSGSGILAIGAVRRGAASAVAFDRDPDAVFEGRRNLARNRVEGVRLFAGEITALSAVFDVVVANLIWEESAPLVSAIALVLAPRGVAVLSGIPDEREDEARRGITGAGMHVVLVERDEEWRTIIVRK